MYSTDILFLHSMHKQLKHNTQPDAQLPSNFLDMDDLTNERSFDLQATQVIHLLGLFIFLAFYSLVFLQPGTGRCPVDWCRNEMSVL